MRLPPVFRLRRFQTWKPVYLGLSRIPETAAPLQGSPRAGDPIAIQVAGDAADALLAGDELPEDSLDYGRLLRVGLQDDLGATT